MPMKTFPHPSCAAALPDLASEATDFVVEQADLLAEAPAGSIVDLACGKGRNGLYLACLGLPVVFWDVNEEALRVVSERAAELGVPAPTRRIDLETGASPFGDGALAGAVVVNYLHRPLFGPLKAALKPGGVVIYETFTTDQARFGKPTNPDFLLRHGELAERFADFEIVASWEGELGEPRRAVARIAARKPTS
jgi:SAM-dependent methyltransferase